MSKNKEVKPTQRDLDYINTFNTSPGQRVIKDLKAWLKHGDNLYNPRQENRDLHYELGRQSVINDILFILEKNSK